MTGKLSVGDHTGISQIFGQFRKEIDSGSSQHLREDTKTVDGKQVTQVYRHTKGTGRWPLWPGRAESIRADRERKREAGYARVETALRTEHPELADAILRDAFGTDDKHDVTFKDLQTLETAVQLEKAFADVEPDLRNKVFQSAVGMDFDNHGPLTPSQMRGALHTLEVAQSRRAHCATISAPPRPNFSGFSVRTHLDSAKFAGRIFDAVQSNPKILKKDNELVGQAYDAYLDKGKDPKKDKQVHREQLRAATQLAWDLPPGGADVRLALRHGSWRDQGVSDEARKLNTAAYAANIGQLEDARRILESGLVSPMDGLESIHFVDPTVPEETHRIYLDVQPNRRADVMKALLPRLASHRPDEAARFQQLKVWPENFDGNDGLVVSLYVKPDEDPMSACDAFLQDVAAVQNDDGLADAFRQRDASARINVRSANGDPPLAGVSMLPTSVRDGDTQVSPGYGIARKAASIYRQMHEDGPVDRSTYLERVQNELQVSLSGDQE